MSDRAKNLSTFWLAVLGATVTTVTVIMQVGEIKGILQNTITNHERALSQLNIDVRSHDAQINELRRDTSVLSSKLHGISTAIGKVPGKVAATIQDQD